MQEIVFENLFRAHYTFLYRTSYALTGRAEDAEDVVQTIFLRLIRREVPPDLEQNPRAYLYRAAVNLSLNSIRSRNRLLFTGDAGRLEVQDCSTAAQSIEKFHKRLCEAIVATNPRRQDSVLARGSGEHRDLPWRRDDSGRAAGQARLIETLERRRHGFRPPAVASDPILEELFPNQCE
jgi:RNA polymerase sigma-70 factor (ECF subfamily)